MIGTTSKLTGSLQLGPDGRIYVAMNNSLYLGVINYPNYKGTACDFAMNGIYLDGKMSRFGLPNFTNDILGQCQSYPKENVNDFVFNFRSGEIDQHNDINLKWTAINNSTPQYLLGVKKKVEAAWEEITTNTNSYVAKDLESDTEYEFRLEAVIMDEGVYEIIHDHSLNQILETSNEDIANGIITVKTGDQFDFQLFPNPAKDQAKIDVDLGDSYASIELQIYNASGKIVYTRNWDDLLGQQVLEVPLSHLPNGMYNVSLKCDKISKNKRFIVMN